MQCLVLRRQKIRLAFENLRKKKSINYIRVIVELVVRHSRYRRRGLSKMGTRKTVEHSYLCNIAAILSNIVMHFASGIIMIRNNI